MNHNKPIDEYYRFKKSRRFLPISSDTKKLDETEAGLRHNALLHKLLGTDEKIKMFEDCELNRLKRRRSRLFSEIHRVSIESLVEALINVNKSIYAKSKNQNRNSFFGFFFKDPHDTI